MRCPPSWIRVDMHATSQVRSRYFYILTARDQYVAKTMSRDECSNMKWKQNI